MDQPARTTPSSNPKNTPALKEAAAAGFRLTVAPHYADERYQWVADYALKAFEETARAADCIDEKAAKFVGFTLTALALVAALLARGGLAPPAKFCLITALALAGFGVVVALWTIRPTEQQDLPEIDHAFAYADSYDDRNQGRAAFIGALHEARVKERNVVLQKAGSLWLAYSLGGVAVLFLLGAAGFAAR